MSKRTPPESTVCDDRATAYAHAVVDGEIIAGPQVRNACARHLRDLEEGPARGLTWDLEAAQHAIGFFEEVLCLNGGRFEGEAFEVLAWQAFVIGSLFGWKGEDGFRRFRVAYVETAKGSGKSPLAAGIGLYGLVADGEWRAEVYAAATKKDQAQILFRDAVAMVDQSPLLAPRIPKSGAPGKEYNLAFHKTSSFFRTVSADDGQSGPRPHIALLDEIHEHKTAMVVEMMRAGTKSRDQALIFMITNSGTDRLTVCWDYHDYAGKVAADTLQDDSFFGYVCELDETDDPFADETCWYKANPSLAYGIPGLKYLREQVTQARGMPSKEATVRRLNFCQWVQADNPAISRDAWLATQEKDFDLEALLGRRCVAGLDLSSTQDLTALVLMFEPTEADPVWRMLPWFWLPEEGLAKKAEQDRVPYLVWQKNGHLNTTPGRAINKRHVLHMLSEISALYDLQGIGYDRWRIEDLTALIDDEGVSLPPLIPVGQGFKDMAPAVDEFERRLINAEMRHAGHPVLTWCAANAIYTEDPAGNRKVDKKKATGRVDGIVAALMATALTLTELEESAPEPGFILL
ncbi:terminase large subunit [Chromohalobacter israelensis]|uniref:terminase large subunit n=1 Tax=Chromohalobacter israelensis TaxID=141390 RepID=UPI00265BC6F9|nr:terminase TerL endonuclease subunit [Chromohalobacter salexigens]MDO0945926.1 terminase large subunit [Chromohalobacter salexigens]